MVKKKKEEEIEELIPEEIPSVDGVIKGAKKISKPKKYPKIDDSLLAKSHHYFVSQPNDVTQAISNLSAVERNCWLQILRGIQKNKDLPEGDPNKYVLTLTRSQLLECVSGHSSNIDYAFNALKSITDSKKIFHSKDGHRIYAGLLSYVDEHPDQETYSVGITPVLLPYFTNFSSEFTVFDMYIEMSFKSVYSQRFYEFCCQFRNKTNNIFFMTVEDIKRMFNIEKDKYKNGADFKRRVLDKAKNDIRKRYDEGLCDLYFDYKVKSKNSRGAVTAYYFIVTSNGNTARLGVDKPVKPASIKVISQDFTKKFTEQLTLINTVLRKHFRIEQASYYVTAISKSIAPVDSATEKVEILDKIIKQIRKIVTRYSKSDYDTNERQICGSICKMLYEDYNIPYMYGKPGKGVQGRLNFSE